jgi:hypothetical protein
LQERKREPQQRATDCQALPQQAIAFLHLIPLIAGMKTRCHHSLLWEAGVLDDG